MPHERLSGWIELFEEKKGTGLLGALLGAKHAWNARYACVRDGARLQWYTDDMSVTEEASAKGWAPLADAEVSVDPDEPLVLALRTHGAAGSASADAPLKFRVPSQEEAEAWVWALYQCAHGAAAKPVAIM
jgi:hypothetical protein